MAKANLSPALHTELSEQLEKQLDEADELDSLREAVGAAFRDEIKRIRLAVARTRRQLKGQELPQREIPGAERAQPKRDPFLQRLMASARELLEYREEQEQGEDEKPEKKGLAAVTLHTAGGKSITATPAQLQAGLDELERRRKKDGPIPEPHLETGVDVGRSPYPGPKAKGAGSPPLTWHSDFDGRVLGVAADGIVYAVEATADGMRWTQGRRRSGSFRPSGGEGALALAKKDAERAELERQGDVRLRNSGAGELTKADTKGPAVARRKGGVRG